LEEYYPAKDFTYRDSYESITTCLNVTATTRRGRGKENPTFELV